ncbi:uncharacterized protein LOC118427026 [Branchiostoma floridae]|uniref:Uncharacterized protein LOC118427026 n=2 Tax=Branchiostoma floridae TaxID=7739 RepID=A0A9J7M0X3_BRAFL|nr:uncharacterized protein LOC118427026 [Branchiostoma floridae]
MLLVAAVVRLTQSNPCRSVPASVLACENGARSNGDTCTVCTRTGGDDPGICWDFSQPKRWLDIPASYLVDWWKQWGSVTSAEAAIDCNYDTFWQTEFTLFPPYNRHWMILDLQTVHKIYEISIVNGNFLFSDVNSFILEASMVDPYDWVHVKSSDSLLILTAETQYFGGFAEMGRYWKITLWTHNGFNIIVRDVCFYGHEVLPKPCPQLHVDCDFDGSGQVVTSETSTEQPCHVSVDIHEGARSKDNPLQVMRNGDLTLHGLVSFDCEDAYEASAIWTVPVNDTYTDVLIDLLLDREDVHPDRLHIYLPANTMPLRVFHFQLQVIMQAPSSSHVSVGVAQTYVTFSPLHIVASLGNAARTVDGGDFWVTAVEESWDPEGVIPSSDFSYNWTCEVVHLPDPTPLVCIDVRDNILIYGGSRYKVYNTRKTASDASTECRKEGGYLASSNDEEEWAAILRLNDCVGVWLTSDPSWVVDYTGPVYASYEVGKALDGNTGTYWDAVGTGRYHNNWYIVLDLTEPHTLIGIALNNYGDTVHDISAFTLQKSDIGSPYSWEDVVTVTCVQGGTDQRQEFGGFQGTARYWKFLVYETHSGWQPWLKELQFQKGGETRTIGVMDEDGDGLWSLSDGTDVTWSAWAPGYPSAPTADACAQVTSGGWSDDISCSSLNRFICELPYSDDCRVNGQNYGGNINYTLEGRDCQTWGTNSPHSETQSPQNSEPDVGNKCRDPGGDGYNWCYTVDPAKRWEECPIPSCAHNAGLVPCDNILGKQMDDADPDGGLLHFEAKCDRQQGATVRISVVVEAEGRPPVYSFLTIHPGESTLNLKCRTNCNSQNYVVSEELALYTEDAAATDWTLVESPAEFPGLDFDTDVSWSSDTEIIVRPDVFWVAGNYTIRLTDDAYGPDSPRIAEWRFRVPLSPWRSSGDPSTEPCRLIPPGGTAVVDKFCITCDDYIDEYGPVQMEVKYEFIPSGVDTPTVRFPGDDPPTVIQFIMSLYTGWVGYTTMVDIAPGTVIIVLRAFSVDGRSTEVELQPIEISTPSLDQLASYMAGLYDNGEGTFFTMIDVGGAEDAFLAAATASGALGVLADSGEDVSETITETIAAMAQLQQPLQDYESVNGVASVLLLVTAFPDQLSPESMVLASSVLKSTFESLRQMSGNSTILSVDAVNRAAGSMFSAVGNVFMASQTLSLSDREAGITYSDVLEASKIATTVGFEALDVLDDIMLNALMPEFTDPDDDEIFADIYTSQVHIRIQRQNRSVLAEKVYQVGGASDCLIRVSSLPPLIGDQCPPDDTVGVQFYESNFNPFEYSNNSKEIQADIPGLSVKCANRTLQVSNLGDPVDILTRRKSMASPEDSMYIFNSAASQGELSTFQIFAKKSMSSFGILVEFNSFLNPQNVTVVLSKHVPPTTDQYNWTTTLPVPDDQLFSIKWINNTFLTADPYMWHLPEDEIDITDADVVNMTEYYVGVQFGTQTDVDSGDVVDFTLSVFETSCVYFAEEPIHLWQSDGCSAGAMSNKTHMHCRCDHLTKFSGFVAPNPLNIQEALSANVLENPAGLVLVLTVFGSYLLLLLFSRKADRRDLTKAGVRILPGHRLNPRKECQYVVTVYTGFKGNAGTTAEISIALHGFEESSPTITFRDPNRILFEKGSVDSFLVSTEQPLGGLTHMQAWHNNAGYSPAWFLNQVIVVNRGTNETTYFLANRWLAINEDDGKIHRIIPTASLEDMTKFRNVFLAKSSR